MIAIDDGRIVAVEQKDAAYSATRTIDASGQYVVPAFVDMHVHWGNGTFAESANIVETTLARSLYYGVTRILNMGSNAASPTEIDQLRLKLEDRTWEGPQIHAVGALISVPGSHPTATIFPPPIQKQIEQQVTAAPEHGAIDLMPLRAITLVRSPDDARRGEAIGGMGCGCDQAYDRVGAWPFRQRSSTDVRRDRSCCRRAGARGRHTRRGSRFSAR